METVESLTPSGVIHARRRAEELEMSAEAVQDAGIEPLMGRPSRPACAGRKSSA